MVDEDPQHFLAGLLHGHDVELRVELGELRLYVLSKVSHGGSGRKKSGPGPLLDTAGSKKLALSIARSFALSASRPCRGSSRRSSPWRLAGPRSRRPRRSG